MKVRWDDFFRGELDTAHDCYVYFTSVLKAMSPSDDGRSTLATGRR